MEDRWIGYKELCDLLNISSKQIQGVWKDWPHILVGKGSTLRNARFNYEKVLEHLEKETRHRHGAT